jgi:hypothetical protein
MFNSLHKDGPLFVKVATVQAIFAKLFLEPLKLFIDAFSAL